jgi:peptide/nickel transport system substrate-binding protein
MVRVRYSHLLTTALLGAGTVIILLISLTLSSAEGAEDKNPANLLSLALSRPNAIWVEEEPSAANAITRLENGELDVYAGLIRDPALAQQIEASPNLAGYYLYGRYHELTFNPSGPIFAGTGKLNPFAVPRVREAMNYLVDREHIAQNIVGRMAIPRWHALNTVSNDYAALADVARALELTYGYNKSLAAQIISQEMSALGAVKVNNLWHYAGEPVEIILLIRTEDERLAIGNYLGDQLEELGFAVIRDYRDEASAGPIWFGGDPAEGAFHIYTGSWIQVGWPRDLAGNFAFFYTDRGFSVPLWQAYVNVPEFYDLARRLDEHEFASLEERRQMMAEALAWAMEDAHRVWLVDYHYITARRAEVGYASDLYGGLTRNWLWPHTLQGASNSLTLGVPEFLTNPWNPLDGINWQLDWDMMLIRATGDADAVPDPYTGLAWPQRILSATVVVQAGMVTTSTLPWLDLQFAPSITVPDDAWVDWNATEKRFVTAAEVYTEPQTALLKSIVYYPADLYDTVTWHDGSPFSPADVVLNMILTFDRAKEESSVYDDFQVGAYNTFMSNFKGLRILSTQPLVIEHYSNAYELHAERSVISWWPFYRRGPGAWHNLALGLRAEAAGEAAFGLAKADWNDVPQLNYVTGPTLDLLATQLTAAQATNYIPYAPTLNQYITSSEAAERWHNLVDWYANRDHFWLGTGPFYLEAITTDPKTASLQRFADYPDPADHWDDFAEPLIPEVMVSGPENIVRGEEATYSIEISFGGQPYNPDDLEAVRYFVFGANGQVVLSGDAERVDGGLMAQSGTTAGLWRVVLDAATTGQLPGGTNRLEIVVISNRVAIPVSGTQPMILAHELHLPLVLRP